MYCRGWFQKLPTYILQTWTQPLIIECKVCHYIVTNVTSGFWRILARLHISAPYTLISCWCVIMSACGDITHHHHDHYVMSTVHLVQHYPDLVLLLPDGLDGLLELVTDVKLVGVKQQDDAVSPLSKPGQYSSEVITPASVCQVACHSVFPV